MPKAREGGGGLGFKNVSYKGIYRRAGYTFQAIQYMNGFIFTSNLKEY